MKKNLEKSLVCAAKKSASDEQIKAQTAKPSEDTIFGKIARKEIPIELLHEDDQVSEESTKEMKNKTKQRDFQRFKSSFQCVAFHDINKQAPTHFLVIPKEPIPQLSACKTSHEKVEKRFFIEKFDEDFH